MTDPIQDASERAEEAFRVAILHEAENERGYDNCKHNPCPLQVEARAAIRSLAAVCIEEAAKEADMHAADHRKFGEDAEREEFVNQAAKLQALSDFASLEQEAMCIADSIRALLPASREEPRDAER